MIFASSVVFPDPLQPANPMMRIGSIYSNPTQKRIAAKLHRPGVRERGPSGHVRKIGHESFPICLLRECLDRSRGCSRGAILGHSGPSGGAMIKQNCTTQMNALLT